MDRTEIIALCIVMALIVMDYATGLAKAVKNKDISSEKMREGLWHKAAYLIVLMLAEILEHGQKIVDMGFTIPIIIPACVYIIVTETTSILENVGQLNPELSGSAIMQLFRNNTTITSTSPKHKAETNK